MKITDTLSILETQIKDYFESGLDETKVDLNIDLTDEFIKKMVKYPPYLPEASTISAYVAILYLLRQNNELKQKT